MNRNEPGLTNILETCLTRMGSGSTIDELVNEFAANAPEKAEELRSLLQAVQAILPEKGSLRVPASAQRNSRQRFLSRAQKIQQQPGATSRQVWLRFLRFFQHHAGTIAFAMTAIVLIFIAFGSTRALPGDGLYPVKLAAEQASNSLPASAANREELVSVYDNRRAEEVNAMIRVKRTGEVSFGGYLSNTKEKRWQVTGINLQIAQATEQKAQDWSGMYVEIKGFLGNTGEVRVENLEPRTETLQGTISSLGADRMTIGSQHVLFNSHTRLTGTPRAGSKVTIQAAHLVDSAQMMAVSILVASETATITPTATTQPTITKEPTKTPLPTLDAKPILVDTPANQNNGKSEPGHPTSESDHEGDTPPSSDH
jgi:hypothetical protein